MFSDFGEGGITSLFLYFLQAGTTEGRVQLCGLFCYWAFIFIYIYREGIDEEDQVPHGSWINDSMYEDYDGINKWVR